MPQCLQKQRGERHGLGNQIIHSLAIAYQHNLTAQDLDKTYPVVVEEQPLTKSDATFAIFKTLRAPWRWLAKLHFIPRSCRDWIYDLMAKNRYRWFGTFDAGGAGAIHLIRNGPKI